MLHKKFRAAFQDWNAAQKRIDVAEQKIQAALLDELRQRTTAQSPKQPQSKNSKVEKK
jgi:hypothetical protein